MNPFDDNEMSFEEWFDFNRDKLNNFYNVIGQRFDFKKGLPVEFYIQYSDGVCNILAEVHELAIEAAQYWRTWIAEESERVCSAKENPEEYERYKKMQPKTLLDFMKNQNSEPKRVHDLIDAMLRTIEHNSSQIQSKLKYMQR